MIPLAHLVLAAVGETGWRHSMLMAVEFDPSQVRLRLEAQNLRTGERVGVERSFFETMPAWQVVRWVRDMVREVEDRCR